MNNADTQLIVAGRSVTIRPMRLTDTEIEADFIRTLSPQSRNHRFLGGIGELSLQNMKYLVDVDGHHSMAFVATIRVNGEEKAIGVSRYAEDTTSDAVSDAREMAVTVADAWQNKGIGMRLTQQLVEYAKGYGIRRLYSLDMAENDAMRTLAGAFGMTATQDPEDTRRVIYSLDL